MADGWMQVRTAFTGELVVGESGLMGLLHRGTCVLDQVGSGDGSLQTSKTVLKVVQCARSTMTLRTVHGQLGYYNNSIFTFLFPPPRPWIAVSYYPF